MDQPPKDFLCTAEILLDSKSCGSGPERSAISRAYYAAFHAALSVFRKAGKPIPCNVNSHRTVIDTFERCGGRFHIVASVLKRLRDYRNSADYWDDEVDFTEDVDVVEQVGHATELVSLIEKIKLEMSEMKLFKSKL